MVACVAAWLAVSVSGPPGRFPFGPCAALPELASAQLKREIQTSGIGADLHIAPQMIETEHVRFNHPGARRHSLQLEFAFFPRHGGQNHVAFSRFDYHAGNGLAFSLYDS